MGDLTNFYSYVPKDKSSDKPKGYKNHFIDKNSRILMIGSSGTGKSNALINFIEKSSGEFFKIIICSLYQYLHEKIPSTELINNIDDVPEVQEFDDKKQK